MREILDADLGVVFIHGIGIQPQGSTLLEFGTSLMEWLRDRMPVTGKVEPMRVVLTSAAGEPAHAVIRLERSDGGVAIQRWLLTEAWWASSFPVPTFTDLARWSLSVVPWTFGEHYGKRIQRVLKARTDMPTIGGLMWALRLVGSMVAMMVGLISSVFALLLLLLLQVLAVVPISGIRIWIGRIQRSLASSVGDSYVLVTNPLEEAAMLTAVRDTIAWTAERARTVVVVAHSQGCAVAFEAVEDGADERLKLLVTFGSGLQKLDELRYVMAHRPFQLAAGLTLVGMLFTIAGAWATAIELSGSQGMAVVGAFDVWFLLIFGAVLLLAGLKDLISGVDTGLTDRILRPQPFEWLDIHASADPVPNGPLIDKGDPTGRVSMLGVVNLGSMSRDHGAYWRNRDEFVSAVAKGLLHLVSDLGLSLTASQEDIIKRVRHRRVALLRAAVWLAAVGVVGLALRYLDAWVEVGQWVIGQIQLWLPWTPEAPTASDPAFEQWLRSVGVFSIVLLVYALAYFAWSIWNSADMRAALRGMAPSGSSRVFFGLTLSVQAVVAELAIPLSVGWRFLAGLAAFLIGAIAIISAPRLPIDSLGFVEVAGTKSPWVVKAAAILLGTLLAGGFAIAMLQDELGWSADDSVLLVGVAFVFTLLVVFGIASLIVWASSKVRALISGRSRRPPDA